MELKYDETVFTTSTDKEIIETYLGGHEKAEKKLPTEN